MIEIESRYNPKETEDKWYSFWENSGFFKASANPEKKPFCIVIPPPNVTGILHMGHALNNSIQDILIRYHRMQGLESLWMPGTDHAGIATQNVVEKKIAKEGLKRQNLGREEFIKRVWLWKEEYGSTIIKQLKKLGASCDWSRIRFTMDDEYSKAVLEVFVRLYEKGLIYRGNRIINWCPRCQTALSDEEAPHNEINGNLYYLKYPFKENPDAFITVATTRPETMLGDTAVAVNPKDKRYKKYIGKILILPLVNREIKVIADDIVDPKFGTGAVKVTPAHDPNDYAMGIKHNLEFINIMHPDAKINENAPDYSNMDRFEAREVLIEDLKEKGFLEKIEPYKVSAAHCYRCHTIIEPYLSKQWFVKMKPLSKPAIEAVKKGKIKFHPNRWTKVYLNWMENIQDWCISRQIWWGHRLPVYYCKSCHQSPVSGHLLPVTSRKPQTTDRRPQTETGIVVSRIKPEKCPACGSIDIYQDEDVLDTWFSSWLWPFATFYWPFNSHQSPVSGHLSETADRRPQTGDQKQNDLSYFYPTSVLVTAPEIIFFWVARMIMAGFEFMGDTPFKDVYIHGTVRDVEGKKMSKSLGNVIDPLEIINEYGTDALRFSLISITSQGQDVYLSKERFEQGRNFANKIWNASRFILMNLDEKSVNKDLCTYFSSQKLDIINRWILSRFYTTLQEVNKQLDNFKFNEAANLLYSFFWHEFCDWYLEIIKQDIKNEHNQLVMYKILEKFLRTLHPIMPFITEEIWQKLNQITKSPNHQVTSIMTEPWTHVQKQIIDKKLEKDVRELFEIITTVRNLRSSLEIKPDQLANIAIFTANKSKEKAINENIAFIKNLAKIDKLIILPENKKPESTISAVTGEIDIYFQFSGLLDLAKEQKKIKDKISNLNSSIKSKEARLKNKEFASKAPREVVEKEEASLKDAKLSIQRLEKMLHELC